MVDRIIPDTGQQAGIPGQWAENWPDSANHFITGHEPGILTDDVRFPAGIDWPAYTPFSYDADGVTAKIAAPGTPIAGFTITPLKTTTPVLSAAYLAGCFNPALIAWPSTFDTAAKKRASGRGAPTPSNIVIRAVRQFTEKTSDYFAP